MTNEDRRDIAYKQGQQARKRGDKSWHCPYRKAQGATPVWMDAWLEGWRDGWKDLGNAR